MYGTQTSICFRENAVRFENDVKMYGTQTSGWMKVRYLGFENDVKMYGTQTLMTAIDLDAGLRMM